MLGVDIDLFWLIGQAYGGLVCLSVHLLVSSYIHMSVHTSISMFVHLSVHLYVCGNISMSLATSPACVHTSVISGNCMNLPGIVMLHVLTVDVC